MFGLLSTGGGDRSLGETGHRGDSRRRSWVVGDLTGALVLDSEAAGRRVGVVEEERVRTVEDRAGLAGRPAREGLRSVMLFFRDPGAGVVEEAREMLVLDKGRAGDGSREASGEGAAEDEAEWEDDVCETKRGHRSVLGVMVAVLEVDSRESVGRRVGVLVGESAEPFAALDDLSIVGCRACGRVGAGRVKAREEWGHVGGRGRGRWRGACQGDVLAGRRAAVRRHQVDHDGRAGMQRGGFARVLAAMVSGVVCRNSTHDPSRRRGPPRTLERPAAESCLGILKSAT